MIDYGSWNDSVLDWLIHDNQPAPNAREHIDRPHWTYDTDGYCIMCSNGNWKPHAPWCEVAALFDLAERYTSDHA